MGTCLMTHTLPKMKKILIIIAVGLLMFGLFGCAKKYNVDYSGQKEFYKGAKDSYKPGQTVHLEYSPIATDTNYYFSANADSFTCTYEPQKGFVIEFVMPEHDVTVECQTKSTMCYDGE